MKRLFAGIKYSPDKEFISAVNLLKTLLVNDYIKWVPENNYHFTLWFFGETHEEQICNISEALRKAAFLTNCSFLLKTSTPGIFGSKYSPRVILLGIEPSNELAALHKRIIENLCLLNNFEDRQNFIPHISIGRIKKIEDKKNFSNSFEKFKNSVSEKSFKVHCFSLFESKLTSEGPIYKEIGVFPFHHDYMSINC